MSCTERTPCAVCRPTWTLAHHLLALQFMDRHPLPADRAAPFPALLPARATGVCATHPGTIAHKAGHR